MNVRTCVLKVVRAAAFTTRFALLHVGCASAGTAFQGHSRGQYRRIASKIFDFFDFFRFFSIFSIFSPKNLSPKNLLHFDRRGATRRAQHFDAHLVGYLLRRFF